MTDNKPQWRGVTLYLVTTRNPKAWAAQYDIYWAAREMSACQQDDDPHVWEVQLGREPVDVTAEARKLVEAA